MKWTLFTLPGPGGPHWSSNIARCVLVSGRKVHWHAHNLLIPCCRQWFQWCMSWYVMVYNPILKVMAPPFLWLQKVFYGPTVKVWFLEVFFSPRTLSSVPFLLFVPKKKTRQERSYQLKGDHLQYIGLYIHIPNQEGLNAAAMKNPRYGSKPGWYPDGTRMVF